MLSPPDPAKQSLDRLSLVIVGTALLLRVALAAGTDLTPDEAYYLSAARLGLTIADHPRLVVWLAAAADAIPLLPLELRIRLPSLVLGTLPAILLLLEARWRGYAPAVQRLVAIMSAWLVLPLTGGFVATPDAALVASSVVLLLALRSSHRAGILVASLAVVVGMLAKMMMLPVVAAIVVVERRTSVRLALMAGVALALPLGMPSLAFQTVHAFVAAEWSIAAAAGALAAALAAQAALWTPFLFTHGARRSVLDNPCDRAVVVTIAALIALSAVVTGRPPEPNWFAPAALVLVLPAARALAQAGRWARGAFLVMGPVAALVASSHALHPWLPIPPSRDPTARLHGWSEGSEVSRELPGVGSYGPTAEECVYRASCEAIRKRGQWLR